MQSFRTAIVFVALFAASCDDDSPEARCGDGVVDPAEECDDANSVDGDGCDRTCTFSSVCGDGARQAGEQCDDGDVLNLDGCDSACQFEQAARITSLQQQFATDEFCAENALGEAITPEGQPTIQLTWDAPVQDGTLSIVFKFLDLMDLSGQTSTFSLGFVNARAAGRTLAESPTCGNSTCEEGTSPGSSETIMSCPDDCIYDGNDDLDWWYVRDPSSVDETETPLVQLPGEITDGVLTAGPGTISLQLLFAFEPAQVTLFNAVIEGALDGPLDEPAISEDGGPPGHLASENLSPTLTSFASASTGSMCSDVSVQSLFDAPMPTLLQLTCTDEGGKNPVFTPKNRLLDAFVAGCRVFGAPGILPVQPDGSTDGAVYQFALSEDLTVASCTKDDAPAELAECVSAATYSSYFKFSSNRVIIKRD
jgi:cysteine-rich repeat protein